jgi:deazaflavin-dependent oxidoreductase (nitroreductase family)
MDISRIVEQRIGVPLLMLHDKIYKSTNGRIGHHIPGGPPSLLLHTIGAKTGQQRTNSLTYAREGDDYLVVASKGGDPKAPGWYHNLKANPNVEINVGPKRFGVTAQPVPPDAADYPRLWQIVNKNNSNRYENYQKRTSRPIPVVRLTPKG